MLSITIMILCIAIVFLVYSIVRLSKDNKTLSKQIHALLTKEYDVVDERVQFKKERDEALVELEKTKVNLISCGEELNTIKNASIASVVGSLKTHASNNNETVGTNNVSSLATKIKESNKLTKQVEIDEFWAWVDAEVAKMTMEERAELEKLINK